MTDLHTDDSDEEKRIMNITWKRFEEQHLTDGYREGALQGKDENFQSGFDRGYEDGFKKAYDIGLKRGQQKALEFLIKTRPQEDTSDRNLHKELCSTCCTTTNTNKPPTN